MINDDTLLAKHVSVDLEPHQFDDPAWEDAQPVQISRYWTGMEASVGKHACVRSIWSDKSLHVRFDCNQEQPLVVSANPQLRNKTLGLWDRDVCEIFIAPFPDQHFRYFEFEAAPTGEWVDLAVWFRGTVRETDFEYSSGFTVATRHAENHIMIGMRIPWTSTIPCPKKDDEWRANLFRCVGLGNERYLAWQPTFTKEPNFHVPTAFGKIRFT